jgi:uncharacterized protein (DUF2235 family)
VRVFRHAIAIDERREYFQVDLWEKSQSFFEERFNKDKKCPQDIKQVWFAGVHADVGGGYNVYLSGLSKFSLIWMIEEASKFGFSIDKALYDRVAWGENLIDQFHAKPTLAAPQNSMSGGWEALGGDDRTIENGSSIHQSVFRCREAIQNYKPRNLPESYEIVPMSVFRG